MTALWFALGLVGAFLMMFASRRAVTHVVALSESLGIPPFLVGMTVVALGTDLPEMVNSVIASYFGHGDINIGDSIGSVVVQGSLVLGLLPFAARNAIEVDRRAVLLLTTATIASLLVGCGTLADGFLSRIDAAILTLTGLCGFAVAWRLRVMAPDSGPDHSTAHLTDRRAGRHAVLAAVFLGAVGLGASGLVHGVVGISRDLELPEYVVSYLGASLGTSLPELVVNITAMRRSQRQIALGGVLGACLLDSSVSIAIGPLAFPTAISADLAARGAAIAISIMVLIALLLGVRARHDRISGGVLIAAYLSTYYFLLRGMGE